MKKLIVKIEDRFYTIDVWNIKHDIDKKNKIFSLISGMDKFGFYFQFKTRKFINYIEEQKDNFFIDLTRLY